MTPTKKLRQLLGRKNKVLAVLGAPNAFHAKIMEANGVEACFVGTSITGGNYTGQPDLGILSMTECVEFAKWIARAVKIPVILDGDTGHGGIMAVRRLVRECIEAGLAGLRLDDQPLDQKRRTGSAGISIVSREDAITRYRVAVDAKNEIDRDFVIMAQCYARNAVNGGMDELLRRLRLYETQGARRLGAVRIAPLGGRDQARPQSRQRAVLGNEGPAAAGAHPQRA